MKKFIEDLHWAYSAYCARTGPSSLTPVSYSAFCEELNQCPYLGIDLTPNRPMTFNRLPLSSWPPPQPDPAHTINLFLDEACVMTTHSTDLVSKTDLHRHYINFCKPRGLQLADYYSFLAHIEAKPGILSGPNIKIRGTNAFAGIRLLKSNSNSNSTPKRRTK